VTDILETSKSLYSTRWLSHIIYRALAYEKGRTMMRPWFTSG
jgi:hypothetical protein